MLTIAALIDAIEAGFDVYVEVGLEMGRYRMIKADAADLHRRLAGDPDKFDAEIPAWLGCEKTIYLGKTTL
jgi:hypothetical protein